MISQKNIDNGLVHTRTPLYPTTNPIRIMCQLLPKPKTFGIHSGGGGSALSISAKHFAADSRIAGGRGRSSTGQRSEGAEPRFKRWNCRNTIDDRIRHRRCLQIGGLVVHNSHISTELLARFNQLVTPLEWGTTGFLGWKVGGGGWW